MVVVVCGGLGWSMYGVSACEHKPWDVLSVKHAGVWGGCELCVHVCARVLVPPNLYIHTLH